jgi:hypothetical protein
MDIWLGDQRVRLFDNLLAYGGNVVMATITAPSLGWDREHCYDLGVHKCSGKLGCRVPVEVAIHYNADAAERQSQLHKAAAQATYRACGKYPKRLAYAPELQARGVIHWHVVLGWATPEERRSSRTYVSQLARLSREYGYGFVDRKLRERPAGIAANYLSKYLTKTRAGDEGSGLRELLVTQQAPTRPVYVSNKLTAVTRCTMRNLRRRRAAHCLWRVRWDLPTTEWVFELLRFDVDVFARAGFGGAGPTLM